MVFKTQVRVRYAETDQMGMAHHSQVLLWLEVARTEYLRSLGYRYRDLEKQGLLMSVIEAQCRYLKPARYDELLTIECWISLLRRLKIEFNYLVKEESGTLLARASTMLGCLSPEGKPSPIPEELFKKFQRLQILNAENKH